MITILKCYPCCSLFLHSLGMFLIAIFVSGCSRTEDNFQRAYLIQVNDSVITVEDFQKSFENATAEFPAGSEIDPTILSEIRLRLLNQLTERLILMERAKELSITVSDQTLENEVSSIKADYPKGEFEQVLLEQAVSYSHWRKDLRIRLLMEKVIDEELNPHITVTPEDIAVYYEENAEILESNSDGEGIDKDINAVIIQQVRNKKKETAYRLWIKALQIRYTINVNKEAWEKVTTLEY